MAVKVVRKMYEDDENEEEEVAEQSRKKQGPKIGMQATAKKGNTKVGAGVSVGEDGVNVNVGASTGKGNTNVGVGASTGDSGTRAGAGASTGKGNTRVGVGGSTGDGGTRAGAGASTGTDNTRVGMGASTGDGGTKTEAGASTKTGKASSKDGKDPNIVGNNFASNAARNLNQFAGKATDFGNKWGDKAAKQAEIAAKNTGTKSAKALAKSQKFKKASENALKMAAKAQKFAKIAAVLGKIIAIAGIVILVLIIIIGLLVFLISGWGMILSGFKEIGRKFWDFCREIIAGAETTVKDDQIINLIDNIETMGYDLYGYGFVSSINTETDDTGNEVEVYHKGGELIENLEEKNAYRYLTAYLISDNYAYYIKNHNFNFRAMTLDKAHFFGGIFNKKTSWGSGLISLYEQDDKGNTNEITGIRGAVYGSLRDAVQHGAALGAMAGSILPGFGTRYWCIMGNTNKRCW